MNKPTDGKCAVLQVRLLGLAKGNVLAAPSFASYITAYCASDASFWQGAEAWLEYYEGKHAIR